MAYATSNPPRLMVAAVGTTAPNWWSYSSADAATVVRVINYFTDALELGMKPGDLIFQSDPAGGVGHIYPVIAVIAAGADLGDGTAIVVTNTD